MGPHGGAAEAARRASRKMRSAVAADQGRAAGAGIGFERQGIGQVDACGTRGRSPMESQATYAAVERMAARGCRGASAACGFRAASQAQIYDASQCTAADLYFILLTAEGGARVLCALSRQRITQIIRHGGRANPAA